MSSRSISNNELNLSLENIKPLEKNAFRKVNPSSTTTIGDTSLEYLDSLELITCKECRIFIYPTLSSTLNHLKVSI